MNAERYQPHSWFYSMNHDVLKNDMKPPNETAVFVYKEDDAFFFNGEYFAYFGHNGIASPVKFNCIDKECPLKYLPYVLKILRVFFINTKML